MVKLTGRITLKIQDACIRGLSAAERIGKASKQISKKKSMGRRPVLGSRMYHKQMHLYRRSCEVAKKAMVKSLARTKLKIDNECIPEIDGRSFCA